MVRSLHSIRTYIIYHILYIIHYVLYIIHYILYIIYYISYIILYIYIHIFCAWCTCVQGWCRPIASMTLRWPPLHLSEPIHFRVSGLISGDLLQHLHGHGSQAIGLALTPSKISKKQRRNIGFSPSLKTIPVINQGWQIPQKWVSRLQKIGQSPIYPGFSIVMAD